MTPTIRKTVGWPSSDNTWEPADNFTGMFVYLFISCFVSLPEPSVNVGDKHLVKEFEQRLAEKKKRKQAEKEKRKAKKKALTPAKRPAPTSALPGRESPPCTPKNRCK